MLYLEDYLELIEQLPQDLRDRLTEMREMDLKVQNAADAVESRAKSFFAVAKKGKPEWRDQQFRILKDEYQKILDDADDKNNMASQIHELVEKYLKKLDQELSKFKFELEADSAGITEILEQRSLQLDQTLAPPSGGHSHSSSHAHHHHHHHHPNHHHHQHKRKHPAIDRHTYYTNDYVMSPSAAAANGASPYCINGVGPYAPPPPTPPHHHPAKIPRPNAQVTSAAAAAAAHQEAELHRSVPLQPGSVPPQQSPAYARRIYKTPYGVPSAGYGTGDGLGLGGGGDAVAASGAHASGAGMVPSNLVTASGVASIPMGSAEMSRSGRKKTATTKAQALHMSGYLSGSSAPPTPSYADAGPIAAASSANMTATDSDMTASASLLGSTDESAVTAAVAVAAVTAVAAGSWLDSVDPNEPRYCTCNQVSYGEMVGCDNAECPYEWFHYGCVGMTEPPKGKWFCASCKAKRRSHGR
eukprot:m.9758 g.9758  ORF g.9758 m.9758 type:complete len:471 (+) comp21608_c0_seq3:27-1439(+)